ncbi:MAG: synaptic vesicle rane protein [Blastocatellia bacterium]|jgi:NADPH:quinone reductase-like Zn-dependent oxidoreductase|nr:synaptic vesicle rane protein [Blastocatellia bacterium]
MRAIVTTRNGGVDALKVETRPDPVPGPGEVLVRVKASGLNFADILARQGLYPDAPPKPCVMGYEVSGNVEAVGNGGDKSLIGEAVFALTRFGGQAELVAVPLTQVFAKPEQLTFEQGAAIPVNYLTAWALLVTMGGLKKDESVLIHNAGGGVGLAALDIAKHIGATTFGTASASKHEFLKARGLGQAIDYRSQDWLAVLMDLTGKRGVELVIDPLGGSSWKKSFRALRATGRMGVFGMSTASANGILGKVRALKAVMQSPRLSPLGLMSRNKGVFGLNLGHLWSEPEKLSTWMKEILNGIDEGWIHPHVDRAFPFDQVADAHRYIEARKNIGKVVLVP